MHWTDEYKTEQELRGALKKGLRKDGVVLDGAGIRVPFRATDSMGGPADKSRTRGDAGAPWMDRGTPQYVRDTAGMSLLDVASAVADHPIRADLSAADMRREAVAKKMGEGFTAGKSDEEVESSFIALVSSCLGQIVRAQQARLTSEAWRGGQ